MVDGRRSAVKARGSEATDALIRCNGLLGSATLITANGPPRVARWMRSQPPSSVVLTHSPSGFEYGEVRILGKPLFLNPQR